MNWKTIFTIARKDLYEARQNKAVWLPIMIVPLVFILVMPLVIIIVASTPSLSGSLSGDSDTARMLEMLPQFMTQATAGLSLTQTFVVMFLGYFFAPFFLILPIMFSTVIASESFAGERERKTIEALLYTPATDTELFIGKVLGAFIPAVLITWASFIGYIIVLNGAGYNLMGRLWFPMTNWYPLIFWVSPALSLLGISATVLISAKVQTFMGAYQTSASLVLLVIALMVGQISGVLYLSVFVSLLLGLGILIVDVILSWLAVRTFNRSHLLGSEA
jgi:ABC-2 type transport system permease protein